MKAHRLFLAAAFVAAGTIAVSESPARATGGSFDCDPGFYQVIAGQFAEFDPQTGVYTPIGADGSNYNAMGHNPADGYIYAIQGKKLLKIDDAGGLTNLGEVPIVSGAYTGDFGDDGLLHVSRGGNDWYAVDVNTLSATRISAFSQGYGVADIANISGVFYGVNNTGKLYTFDPVTGVATNHGQVQGLSTDRKAFGAAWTTAGNNFYVGRNSGEIYQITGYSTGNPVATRVLTAPSTNSNDGAACPYAPQPAGIPDVDGAEPEVEPTTAQGIAAAEEYEENYEEPAFIVPDAGLGTGASCEATVDVARNARTAVAPIVVTSPTVLYANGFGDNAAGMHITDGSWSVENGAFRQQNTCGFDYGALIKDHVVESFDLEVTFHAETGVNQGGVVFHQSSVDTRSGATVIDLADEGETLRWGYYDAEGFYQNVGWDFVPAPETGENVTIRIESRGSNYTVFLNGTQITTQTAAQSGGMTGLVASVSDIAFDSVTLTAVPG